MFGVYHIMMMMMMMTFSIGVHDRLLFIGSFIQSYLILENSQFKFNLFKMRKNKHQPAQTHIVSFMYSPTLNCVSYINIM